jgi:8-oxo-dGTP pyrophosphatase MutT (NUDIX family)
MDVVLGDGRDCVPDGYQVTTAFVLAFDTSRRVLLTRVDRPGRGWDVPGGHVEDGESPAHAAARELAEETGLVVPPADLEPVGGQRITLLAEPPPGYRYPRRAYMAFHTLRLDVAGQPTRPAPGSECGEAAWLAAEDVRRHCVGAAWLPLYEALLEDAQVLDPDRPVTYLGHPGPDESLRAETVLAFSGLCLVKAVGGDDWHMGSLNSDGSVDCWASYARVGDAIRGL